MAAVWARVVLAPAQWSKQAIRPISVGAVLSAKSSAKSSSSLDPVQQLFLDKLKEYKTKSTGGKLPDMTAELEKQYQDELSRVHRVFGGGDMSKFPEFNFVDKTPTSED